MWRSAVFIVALVAFVKSQTTQVSQCIANQGNLPQNIYIENCITPPCLLPQLQDTRILMMFRAPHSMPHMRTMGTMYMSVFGITVPIEYDFGENSETCNFLLNSSCPVQEGEVLFHQLNMYIEPFVPVGSQLSLELRIVDQNNVPVVCVRFMIHITEPVNARIEATANATFVEVN